MSSFNAMKKAAAGIAESEQNVDDDIPPAEAAPKPAAAASAPVAAEKPAEAPAAADPDAPTSFDAELESVLVGRDIATEAVEPPTRTEAEAEMAAAAPSAGGDPALPGALPENEASATTDGEPAAAPAAGPAPSESAPEAAPAFKLDEDELRSLGLDDLTIAAIRGLSPIRASEVVSEIRQKHSLAGELKDRKAKLEEAMTKPPSAQGSGGLFAGVGSLFRPNPHARRLAKTEKEAKSIEDYLGNSSVRDRVNRLRRQEIVEDANALSADHRRLSAAMHAFNTSMLATPAGQAFEKEVASILERHPNLDRGTVIAASKDGRLASMIGSDPLTPIVQQAFANPDVRRSWDKVSAIGDRIESRGGSLASRMDAYEEHFPGEVDAHKLHDAVAEAMNGLDKTAQQALAEDPAAKTSFRERMQELAKQLLEFIQKLMAKFFGPKP